MVGSCDGYPPTPPPTSLLPTFFLLPCLYERQAHHAQLSLSSETSSCLGRCSDLRSKKKKNYEIKKKKPKKPYIKHPAGTSSLQGLGFPKAPKPEDIFKLLIGDEDFSLRFLVSSSQQRIPL